MGYNGNNRKGVRSSMFKKSAYKSGSNMLFGKNGINFATQLIIKTASNYE